MSFVATMSEGKLLKQHFRETDGVAEIPLSILGVLRFTLEVTDLSVSDVQELLDDFDDINSTPDLFVEDDAAFDLLPDGTVSYIRGGIKVIKFEYFITNDLLPLYRAVIDKFCGAYYNCHLLRWSYSAA